MSHWMFRCHEVSQKVSQTMDSPLPLRQRLAIRIHLMMCRYCARFRRQLLTIRMISRAEEPERTTGESPDTLSEETRSRIKAMLRSLY